MGLHAMYDWHKNNKMAQIPTRDWIVSFRDPDTGMWDDLEFMTEVEARVEVVKLQLDYPGLVPVVQHVPFVDGRRRIPRV